MVDDFNWLYRPSNFRSLRYTDIKELNYYIPPYHFALCWLFMNLDGHQIRNGYKVVSTSNATIMKHNFEPEKINYPDYIGVRLDGVGEEGV